MRLSIIDQQRRLGVNTIQICDRLTHGSYQELREALPGVSLVQVVHVTGPEAVDEAIAVAPEVDAVLLDSGNQSLAIKELGGTGRTHDWTLSRKIREAIEVPLFLAGGLNPSNVAAAIREVQPFGIDVCSGLRTNGNLDREKLEAFFDRISRLTGFTRQSCKSWNPVKTTSPSRTLTSPPTAPAVDRRRPAAGTRRS